MKNKNKQTKFPVARIKKIMQKDEEVGKVAQATPVVISKALELFLGLIIDQAHQVTSKRGSKKVEIYHLKYAVENTEELDFLKELVQDIHDPTDGGKLDLEMDEGKRKRGKGKKSAAAAAAAGGNGAEPDAPKKKRKRKADAEAVAIEKDDGPVKGWPKATSSLEERDEDVKMQNDDEDYDEEEPQPPGPSPKRSLPQLHTKPSSSKKKRIQTPSEEDDEWDDDEPFTPARKRQE